MTVDHDVVIAIAIEFDIAIVIDILTSQRLS
jgi:hypothetical protein